MICDKNSKMCMQDISYFLANNGISGCSDNGLLWICRLKTPAFDLTSFQMPKTQHGLVSLVDGNGLELIVLIHQRQVVFKEITHIEVVILGSHD